MAHTSDLLLSVETHISASKMRVSLAVIDETFAFINRLGSWMDELDIHRLKGELSDPSSLCCILQNQGRQEQTRRQLSWIYTWF